MRGEMFDFIGNLDTLAAVFTGAILATLGGVAATQIEERVDRTRRERDAARFFGEVLASIEIVVEDAAATRKIGDPYGPVTMRMLTTARREVEIYERNRERLFEIRDPLLRARIQRHVLRVTLPLESVIDSSQDIAELEERLHDGQAPVGEQKQKLEERMASKRQYREFAFDLMMRQSTGCNIICADLQKLAGIDFGAVARAAKEGGQGQPPAAQP
jgi:hypothetical protein